MCFQPVEEMSIPPLTPSHGDWRQLNPSLVEKHRNGDCKAAPVQRVGGGGGVVRGGTSGSDQLHSLLEKHRREKRGTLNMEVLPLSFRKVPPRFRKVPP